MENIIKAGYIGTPAQLYRLRRVISGEGKSRGTEIIEVSTAGGLALDILPDNGLDIGQAFYKGVNVSWMCKNGYDSPFVDNAFEREFLNTFPGGLIYSCGLRNAGDAHDDGGEWQPHHGKYHYLPAEHVCTECVDNVIIVRGTVRETLLYGHSLEVNRTIKIPVFGSEISVEETVTNRTPYDEEIMRIFHCNFGYPFLSEKAKLVLPEERTTLPRTEYAASGLDHQLDFEKPMPTDPDKRERVFFQHMKDDFRVELQNPELGIGMKMTWNGETMPILSQWRSLTFGDYVLGLEPTNCYIKGRADERKNGTLPVLKAFESVNYSINIKFSDLK